MWAVALALALATSARALQQQPQPSWLRVSLAQQQTGAPAVVEHGWRRTPPVGLEALFGTNRLGVAVGPHTLWFEYHLNRDVIAHAATRNDLEHAVQVTLSEAQAYRTVAVSPDVARALREASLHGLEARVRASALQLSAECAARVGDNPTITNELAWCVAKDAFAWMGVF